jgi:hypothetical protein
MVNLSNSIPTAQQRQIKLLLKPPIADKTQTVSPKKSKKAQNPLKDV